MNDRRFSLDYRCVPSLPACDVAGEASPTFPDEVTELPDRVDLILGDFIVRRGHQLFEGLLLEGSQVLFLGEHERHSAFRIVRPYNES
jgi:hypothetical protein